MPGKLDRARHTVAGTIANISLSSARVAKAAASQEPFTFYNSALKDARQFALKEAREKPGLWKDDLEDVDIRVEEENERFERFEDPRQFERMEKHNDADDETYTMVNLRAVLLQDWRHFRDFWNATISRFWKKVKALQRGSFTTGLLFRLLDVKLSKRPKRGFRPYIKERKHSRRVLFKVKRSTYKRGCITIPGPKTPVPRYRIQHSKDCVCHSRHLFGLRQKRQIRLVHQKETLCDEADEQSVRMTVAGRP